VEFQYTEFEKRWLEDTTNAAHLRELLNSVGWQLYLRFAHERIDAMLKEYLREDLSREEIYDKHTKLQAVTKFQAAMEDLVKGAVNFLSPQNMQDMIVLSRIEPDV
jgi:hypothetical protein